MKILIDNGHGEETPGKRSPKGWTYGVREYEWTRDCAKRLVLALKEIGYDAELLTPETNDVPLNMRVRRANHAGKDSIVISLHNNAAGSGDVWRDARGFGAYVSLNASEKSKRLATMITESMAAVGIKVRKPNDTTAYWPQNLAICRDTIMPAVLTENLFMDNKEDVQFLCTEDGINKIVAAHVAGIVKYIHSCKK